MMMISLFLTVIIFNVVGNVFFKIGANNMPTIGSAPFLEVLKSVINKWFLLGTLAFAISFPTFVLLLLRQKLSIAYPVVTAATFLLITLASVIWLKEDLRAIQFIGIFVIIAGIAMLAQG